MQFPALQKVFLSDKDFLQDVNNILDNFPKIFFNTINYYKKTIKLTHICIYLQSWS